MKILLDKHLKGNKMIKKTILSAALLTSTLSGAFAADYNLGDKLTKSMKISTDSEVEYRGTTVELDDEDELVRELQDSAINYKMTVAEFKSVLTYTSSDAYFDYNDALWGAKTKSDLKPFMKDFDADINRALNKLPSCNGKTVYRGTSIRADELEKFKTKYTKGAILTYKGLSSTSDQKDVAEDFSEGLLLIIKCKTKAHDVHTVSVYGKDESEYLYPSFSKFKVISHKITDQDDGEVYEAEVTLEEI
ncbi:MAG: hypothetical protein ACI9QD_000076 [Thermoproteota archaeon]|jgi:hypothetical protein